VSEDLKTSFLTYYVRSLAERTREEKRGTKFGFDWIIYNLALAEDWRPHRLPFLRAGPNDTSKAKTEPEFGVDLAFVSPDHETLRIFVLKDEVLNNTNWTRQSFDIDLRNASAPDLSEPELRTIKHVEVILAYNKDEDRTGIELFERRIASLGSRAGDQASLGFDRWNLTEIVSRVKTSLLTPSLLPQKFFSQFSYICSQFADFRDGSDEWNNQLIPNWRRFLASVLVENADERCARLLPVALLILREHGNDNPTAETGWIDLMEWGMLAAWRVVQVGPEREGVAKAVLQMWIEFYLAELERYYTAHADDLRVRYSLDIRMSGSFIDTVASAVVAHCHLARLSILGIGYHELLPSETEEDGRRHAEVAAMVSNWLVGILAGNPSTMRPLVDLHHIELFLVWYCLRRAGRWLDMASWLRMLCNRLSMRRSNLAELPFIEGGNSIDLIFEYVARGEKPEEFCDTSSVYLAALMEMTCALTASQRDPLLENIYGRLVLGRTDCGEQMQNCQPIDLMIWLPPADWGDRVLTQSLASEGECVTIRLGSLGGKEPSTGSEIVDALTNFVAETRRRESKAPTGVPAAAVLLACVKHRSPLPPEFWRRLVFTAPAGTPAT
jgi:hypothetical protein